MPGIQGKPTLATAQQQARQQLLFGRERQLAAFEALLANGETPRILYLHGPGGIGKSTLLAGFEARAQARGVGVARLDARLLTAAPEAVRQAVNQALTRVDAPPGRMQVLALDHAEHWGALDEWLRTDLLPALPATLILAIASRQAPSAEWRADPGVSEFLIDYELAPLSEEQSAAYLQQRGAPDAQQDSIMAFARGSPLALALAADQAVRAPHQDFDADTSPDLFRTLVEWLLRDLQEPLYRQAVEACATVRRLSQPLLATMLDRDDTGPIYDWLAKQHFVERQADGLVIHDLLREAVIQDLRARDLVRHHTLIRRATTYIVSGLDTMPVAARFLAAADGIYTLRHEPFIQKHLGFGTANCYPDTAHPDEIPGLAAEVEQLEGTESRRWFEHWLDHETSELLILRYRSQNPAALCLLVTVDAAEVTTDHEDPCIQALAGHLHQHAPLREGETMLLARFMMAHDTHQAQTPVWAELAAQFNARMFMPGISLLGNVADLAYDRSGIEENVAYRLLSDSEFRIGDRRCMVVAHDIRAEPPWEWGHNSVERILRGGNAPELLPSPAALLQWPAFNDAVRQAVRDFNDDTALAESPLLESPMLRRHVAQRDVDALRTLIRETSAAELGASQTPGNAHEILELVYFEPAAKLQAAAAELNVSERTLRRRTRQAEERLAEALWRLDTQID